MSNETRIDPIEFSSKLWLDFDESTLISPNKNGENEKGSIVKSEYEFKKRNLAEFVDSNSITVKELLLASLTLTLNKFNFSHETLIFNENNVPFATKFENRQISIKEFLEKIHEGYLDSLQCGEHHDASDFPFKPEFYYSFNQQDCDFECSNFLSMIEKDENVLLSLSYNNELYTEEYIDLFLSSLENVIHQIIGDGIEKTNICDIALVDEKEDIAFSEVEMPLIHKRFEKHVIEKCDEIALVASDATLTYGQLDEKANIIANALIDNGVEPKSNVLVMLSRDSNLVASIFGILKAGCAFIPIDPEYPQERINYIFENSQADYIISNESGEKSLDIKELLKEGNSENPDVDVEADDLAYMIYTSGSTGNPKGVMISHENICNQVSNPKSTYDSLLCITTISFDVALDDILTSLSNGLKLIFANDVQIKNIPELTKLINENKPEVADFTPSRLASYLEVREFCKAISCLKCIFIGGEQFSAKVYEDLRKYSDAVVYNSYGPTETTITSNNKEVTDVNDITVGFPLDNYITDVRDIDGKLVPNGVMGELYVGGTGVGKGYYNLEDKTKEVFLTINGIPYYRSGDYSIQLPNGEIDIKGRIDNQIKLRGLRIEIGEIETNIGQYPNIKQVAVVIRRINNNDHLCAYFTADVEIDCDVLKEYLKGKLTRYMVPTVFMQLDEMPQTPNGKTDLKKLPQPQLRLTLTLPETETEIRLHEIVSSISKTRDFGTNDDLYAIGFTSLTLIKLNAMIYDEMGVNLDIVALLNDPTIKNIANEIENNEIFDERSVIELSRDMVYYPLTENQMGIYYECIQSGDVAQYNLPSIIRFGNEIDADKLKDAIIKTIDAYPYLKTRIVTQKGNVVMKRDDSIAIDEIPIVNVDNISDEEIESENLKRFDLHNGQLFRFKIYKTLDETILFSDVHHIISDGESLDKLFTNIANVYQGIEIQKEEVDGYINCLIESENENSEKYEVSKEFFYDALAQEVDSTILTPNLNGNYEEGILKHISKNIDSKLVNKFCSENKITPNVLFMAVTMLNLNKYTFADKTLITTIFNGRSKSSYINTQALMVKTLPIVSINEDRTLTIKEYLKSVNDIWMETISHSDYPYTKISEEFRLKPEFFYAYNNLDAEEIEIDDNIYKVKYLDSLEVNYKISLDVNETKDNIELLIQYNDQLYSADYIDVFLNCIINVINQLIEEDIKELTLGEIELGESKETPIFAPVDTPILHKRFEKQVIDKGDEIALVASDATLTYAELDQKANIIANALIKRGVKPKSNVLVMLSRNSNLIASILGILKAGCAFIPIDPEYPKDRINYIYENSDADYIITDKAIENSLDVNELLKEENIENPEVDVNPDDLAYMIYTSGSTGNPKGVMICHENICNQASNPKSTYDSLLCVTTISFDVSVDDILTSLSNGLKLIFADDIQVKNIPELIKLIEENKPEVLEITPSRFASYLEVGEFCNAISCFKCLFLGGEQFSAKVYEDLRKYSDAVVYNSYGPTETTITSNNKEVTDVNDLSVGLPLTNYITDVRDIDGKLVPNGVMGELYIGGVGVGKGYYNMEEKTKEAFLTIDGIPYYRSGDYAIELLNGEIDIKGRIDNQIKLRGLRIEIGEIETNIAHYPNIKQVTVVIKEINGYDHLCAYYTAEEQIDSDDLKEYLKDHLTRYMVPTVFMQLDAMPKTPNGKTDLKQLPEPQLKLALVMPETDTEEKLLKIVSSIVNIDEFGVTDDLYSLGFTSLTLMKLNSIIYEQMGGNLDVSILFNDPTIKNFAIELDNSFENESGLEKLIESAKGMEYYPLTENQLGIYYECVQNPDVIKYTMPTTVRFGSDVDANRLKGAVIKTIDAHPYLKTRIVTHEGELKQKRCDDVEIDNIEIVKVGSINDEEIAKNDVSPIPLDNNQLFKFKIYETPEEVVLFSDFHHIITDGVSQNNLFGNIADIYENKDIEEEIVDGYIYSLLENDLESSERYKSAKEFFDEKLTQEIESTILTPDLNGNPKEGKIKRIGDAIDSQSINKFCNDNSISKNTLFMASVILGLNKFTFSDKTLITTIFNGRSSPNYFNTQGFLVKTVPLAINNEDRQSSIRDFIKSVDQTWKDTLKNSLYPYIKLAEEYQLKPEFFYTYHEFLKSDDMIINSKSYEPQDLACEDLVTVDSKISLAIYDNDDKFDFVMEYNDQLYSEGYVKVFMESMKNILVQFLENDIDEYRICDVKLNDEELHEFSEVKLPFIHKRFERQVEETPDNIALIASDATLTYRELNQRANSIANALIKRGVKPRTNVLIMLQRNSNLFSAILGVLKAGCAYIPIDLEYPIERIEYIYQNSQAEYIISNQKTDKSLGINELIDEANSDAPDVEIAPEDTAYMIYTSGSTGNPKGVMISHRNITNLFVESEENLTYQVYLNMKRILSTTTVSFDPFLLDLMGLTMGLEVVLANDDEVKNIPDLTELIHREKPDTALFTPSRIMQYMEYEGFRSELNNFTIIAMGGEMMPKKLVSELTENTDISVYNCYGPTETTVMSNFKKISHVEEISIGKALYNYITDVRDIDGKLLPQGVIGELYIGGMGVGKGYYNMPEKTKEAFTTINNIPYYRSGDYAIELPNGDIDIKGRIDNQIKLRGLRIEIGEIESNINRFPNIKQTVVAIKKIHNNDHLCAYFTADAEIDINLLRRYLKNKLTKYMVPTAFVQLEEMPQSPNGKTDMKMLPDPDLDLENVKPENETEEKLFKLASEMIGTSDFGTTDDLYELGFTSLTLMKLNSMIFNETNVNIDIASLFTNPTIKSLADKIDNNIESDIDMEEIIETAKDMQYFPLTANQLGIYYECMQSEKIKYTMPIAVRFDASINPNRLKEALIETVEAHPYIKTRIVNTDDGRIMQKRCDDVEIDEIEIVEMDSISNNEIMENDIKPIPLGDNQLFRFKIYKTPKETVLFTDFHHIITDGVSQGNFFNDLTKAYNNEEIATEKIDGYAYSLIEEETSLREVSKKFFKAKFGQGIESTVLTPNINGNPDIGNIKIVSDVVDSTFVRHFCQDHSISPNVLFMTATILTLDKFTFSDKSLITTIFNGRANSNFFNTQGMLVKTLPIIVNGENRDMMVEDYIKIVDKSWKDALTHSDYPYTKLAEDYQLKPEFFYAYHESLNDEIMLNGRSYETIDLDGTVATDYKINMDVFDDGEDINLYIEYNDQIYTEDYVKLFVHSIKYVLFQFFVNDMDKLKIKDIELEKGEIPKFEELSIPFLHKRFERQVEMKPDGIALVATDATLTYAELNQKANIIANELIKKGVKPKSNVLVMLPRDSNLIAAIIAIFKAGGTFVPIDLEYPQERIDYIYENSQADYIINVGGELDNSIDIKELIKGENTANPEVDITPDELAYMIYTSGSTGNPKGVMISHKNACNQSESNPKCEYSSILSIATIAFDTSLEDILTGITNGIKIIFANDIEIKNIVDLIDLIKDNQPEVMEFTPSRLLSYLEIEEFCDVISCGKCIVMGGEQFSSKAFNGIKQYSDAKVYNSYGPTEATIASNYKEITDPEIITVGKALKNYVTEVRDIDGKLLPRGVMGELYIGGTGVGKGYYNMPEKTAEVYTTINGIPYYRSGDYAIELPNGEIDIKGRIDNQIKLRGLRIEIGEIESNIYRFSQIKQAIVVIKKINNTEHLCAYYTSDVEIDKIQLKEYLEERLTKYMVPTVFMQIDEMPQLPNGKTDTKRLPEPKTEINYVAPETPLEQEICAIFSNVLNVETVGAEDNFFEIGGTSLVASKLIIELLKQDYSVKYDDIFHNQTPRKLAKFLSGEVQIEYDEVEIIKNYNYDEINRLLEENTLESFLEGEKQELGNVLLTGVTGFLGIHVLYEYIKNETGTVYCMLRKGKFNSCEERLVDLMDHYFNENFSDLIGTRIILSEGDVTELDDFRRLEDCPIDTIINCAAIVKHYTVDDYIFKVNVDGVINGLKFAGSKNNLRYVQISTISVLSSFSENEDAYPDMKYNERTLYYEQDLTNKYLASKFLAERMILEAATKGLPVKIIRVGNLMARFSDGVFQKNYETNAFLNNIKAFKNIKAITSLMSKEEIDMSQIDYVAKSVLELSKTPEKCRLFHSMNNHYVSHGDIIDALNDYGYGIREVSNEEFKEIYDKNMDENIQGLITAEISLEDYAEEDSFEGLVEIKQTTEILNLLGFDWPKPDKDYLKRMIDYLNKFNYFE